VGQPGDSGALTTDGAKLDVPTPAGGGGMLPGGGGMLPGGPQHGLGGQQGGAVATVPPWQHL
jgi:hypothetical protein